MTETIPAWLPFGFFEWMPLRQATTLGVLTFIQEDVPTVTAAVLAAAGNLTWSAAFWGCFLGIWVGDALLYSVARFFGRPIMNRPFARRFFDSNSIARSERWFDEKGSWLLVSSRFLPGSRLPTYLAAGFLRLNVWRFLAITAATVGVWTGLLFLVARTAGAGLVEILRTWNTGVAAIWLSVLGIISAIYLLPKLLDSRSRLRIAAFFQRCAHWEFWPAWLFYAPVLVNYLYLAIRYRGLTLPTAANPGIYSGGIVGESKIATLQQLQKSNPDFVAHAILVESVDVLPTTYPFILKPDIGLRGVGVKLIRSPEQATQYLNASPVPLICQQYASGPGEVGIFYYRFPGERRGRIFAITEKIFPFVTGDGEKTIEELIWQDQRARCVARTYFNRFGQRRNEIPAAGEKIKLVEAGNHAQGCIFKDGMHLWSEALENRIDQITQSIDGFFIGRFDIRFSSEQDLRNGAKFQIIELNGAASEATSIYDSRNSLFSAYRTLFRQWDLVFAIGAANRRTGSRTTDPTELWRKWRQTSAMIALYPTAD
jgi:membrane protein DedA with SNARE-associated domain